MINYKCLFSFLLAIFLLIDRLATSLGILKCVVVCCDYSG